MIINRQLLTVLVLLSSFLAFFKLCSVWSDRDSRAVDSLPVAPDEEAVTLVLFLTPAAQNQGVLSV